MSCVYKHTFPNGAVYIGRTDMKPEERWLNGWGYKNCPLMFNAILQFGWANVQHEIIADNLTKEESIELEHQQIVLHSGSCTVPYNIEGIPPQYLAQENAHFIDQNDTQSNPQERPQDRVYKKQYIIPLVPKPLGNRTCAIDVYTKDGSFICTYPSATIASHELGVNNGDIISCCKGIKSNGQPRYQVKGYIFRYSNK